MKIQCRLSVLMGEKRYNIQQVYEQTGLSRSTISNLYHNKAERYDAVTLSKLCKLFKCDVGDILVCEEEKE